MAQQQINVNLPSVGSSGLNTETSPIVQNYSFAAVAENAVIDSLGRIASRFAFSTRTVNFPSLPAIPSAVSHNIVIDIIEGSLINEAVSVLCTGRYIGYNSDGLPIGEQAYIFEQQGDDLVEIAFPALNDDTTLKTAMIVPTEDRFYIYSATNEVLVWDGATVTTMASQVGYQPIENVASIFETPTFDRAIAAYGRIWATGHDGDMNTVYYSDLLIGASNFTVSGVDPLSTAGKLNVLENWPNGKDSIQALESHDNRLIIFGKESILIYNSGYGDPADPSSGFTLEDTISNVGCVSKYSIVNIGTDVLFVDATGVRSLGRTIQERSSPMGDLTNNVRSDFSVLVSSTLDPETVKMEHDNNNNLVVVLFGDDSLAYCLDMKAYRSAGTAKITRWTNCYFSDMTYVDAINPNFYLAGDEGLGVLEYSGYLSAQDNFTFKYYSNQLTFDEPARLKFLKQVDMTIITSLAPSTAFVKWGYNTLDSFKSKSLVLDAVEPYYYTESEYTVALFGGSASTLKRYRANVSGSGEAVKIGLEVTIDGNGCSLQEINIQTLIGRIR